jgi:molybdopterin-guanine dinucleotide biosynthesis protein A
MSENSSTLQPQSTTGSSVASTSSESAISITAIAQQPADVESSSSSSYVGQRGPKRKAPLWNYFDEIKTGNDIFAVCKQTDCSYKNKGKNNSTLKNHLVKHPEQYEQYLKQQAEFECKESEKSRKVSDQSNQISQQTKLYSFFKRSAPTTGVSAYPRNSLKFKEIQHSLTTLAACTSMPISMVDSEEFHQFVFTLDPQAAASLPTRNTLKSWVLQMASDMQHTVARNATEAKKFSLCCDLWSQPGLTHSYIGVTMHYYNTQKNRLETAALACRELPHPHTAVAIREAIQKILENWHLKEEDVVRYVTDAGANIVAALRPFVIMETAGDDSESEEMEEDESHEQEEMTAEDNASDDLSSSSNTVEAFFNTVSNVQRVFPRRNSCYAHMSNVICHAVLDNRKSPVQKLREKVMPIVNKFATSGVATELLKCLAGKKLLKVAQTRWNSFYYVISRLLEVKEEVVVVCAKRDWPISFAWSEVEMCRDLLKPLADATNYLQGDKYSTSSAVVPFIISIEEHLSTTSDNKFSSARKHLLEEFCKRFASVINPTD